MKLNRIVPLLAGLLLLSGCAGNEEVSVSLESLTPSLESEEEVISSEESIVSEEIIPSEESTEEITTTYSFAFEDAPKRASSGYPADQEITAGDGAKYFVSSVQQGGGKGEGTVQMKKEVSYLYNITPMGGTITAKIMRNIVTYSGTEQDQTGIPTIYTGESEHPSETTIELTSKIDGDYIYYMGKIGTYFTFADESSNAIYLASLTIAF